MGIIALIARNIALALSIIVFVIDLYVLIIIIHNEKR